MSPRRFIGRESELSAIRRELDRDRPSLIVVYGRRRVGKSTLLLEAVRDREAVYFQAAQLVTSENIAAFKQELTGVLGPDPVLEGLGDWSALLSRLAETTRGRDLTVILDEFPYLCSDEPALPSILQRFWDGIKRQPFKLNLVLCGSTISFMEELLAEKNPLHGRQTLDLSLGPMSLREAAHFFPSWSPEQQTRAYGIFGGIPYYLDLCNPDESLEENMVDLILNRGAPLAFEPNHILQAELTAITRYATLLRAVADGCTRSGEIIARVPEIQNASQLAPYIRKLGALRLIRIVRSMDATDRERNRRYEMDDAFLGFWYRFCLPNLSALEAGHGRDILRLKILPHLDDHLGNIFEEFCRNHLRKYIQDILPSPSIEVGRIWSANFDIDVVATLADGDAVFAECKWWKRPVGVNILDRLTETCVQSGFKSGAPSRHLIIFARRGFTEALIERSTPESNLHLLTCDDLVG